MEREILEKLKNAVVEQSKEKAKAAAEELVAAGLDPVDGIEKGLGAGMTVIGDKFSRMECFLPELIFASDAFTAGAEVLEPEIRRRGAAIRKRGVVVIGTVKGDIHKIGKDIVAMLMRTRGFEVYDLGIDVSISTFMGKAAEYNADIIAMSALLTTTMPVQKRLIDLLKDQDVRDKYRVMVGGAPVTGQWADEIGADAYGANATEAVELALQLVE